MADAGHRETEKILKDIEKRLRKEYQQAANEIEDKIKDYWRRYEAKDEIWQRRVAKGEVTAKEYAEWKKGQLIVGENWKNLKNEISNDLLNANKIARETVSGYMGQVYAENFNFGVYDVEMKLGYDTGFVLYDRDSIGRIVRDNPNILPPNPGKTVREAVASGKAKLWERGQIQSVTMQSILQGESIPEMAKRIANTLGEINHKDSIRYARTAITGAQNAGRVDAYHRAKDMGINLQQEWVATLDNRTRHEHRILDGQKAEVGEPFKVNGDTIMFPGDPSAPGYLVWNCRCTLEAAVKGWEKISRKDRSLSAIKESSYEEWKKGHGESRNIEYQEKVGEAIKYSYIGELYKGK